MDRAPNLQDVPSETSDKPEPEGRGYDYKELAREVLARIDQRLADLQTEPPPDPSEAQFGSVRTSGIMRSDDQAAFVRMARRGLIGLLLSASLVAAISFVWSHRDTASYVVTQRVPQFVVSSIMGTEKPGSVAPPAAKATAATASADAAHPPRAAPNSETANPAPVSPELAELMRKVDRNLAGLAQAVTELRLAHQQTTNDNANTVKDIRASLDQMSHAIAGSTSSAASGSAASGSTSAMSAMARAPDRVTQANPPAPPTTARRSRRYVPPYMSPSDALGFMR